MYWLDPGVGPGVVRSIGSPGETGGTARMAYSSEVVGDWTWSHDPQDPYFACERSRTRKAW